MYFDVEKWIERLNTRYAAGLVKEKFFVIATKPKRNNYQKKVTRNVLETYAVETK